MLWLDSIIPSLVPPAPSVQLKLLWPEHWWQLRWIWLPPESAPQSSSSHLPPDYKRGTPTVNKHTVLQIFETFIQTWRPLPLKTWTGLVYNTVSLCPVIIHSVTKMYTVCDPVVRLTGSVWMLLLCKKPSDLGFGPGPQLLQFLGSCFNSCRCSKQLILCDDGGILRIHPLCAYNK